MTKDELQKLYDLQKELTKQFMSASRDTLDDDIAYQKLLIATSAAQLAYEKAVREFVAQEAA